MRVGIIGAGPAGMTAAYALQKKGVDVTVFEASPFVGGMSRSMDLWDYRVDIGPHRFFSTDPRVNGIWREVIGSDYRAIDRLTRIYYRRRFFDYPLRPANVFANLSVVEIARIIASYAREQVAPEFPMGKRETFEAWVVHNFGRRLFEMFFKSYSEKLWGIRCDELDADFAAQRIKKFSLGQSMLAAMGIGKKKHKTLVDVFTYPKAGSGELYERMAQRVIAGGGTIRRSCPVKRVLGRGETVTGVVLDDGSEHAFDHVVSTMPLTILVNGLDDVPPEVSSAVAALRFRNTILVFLRIDSEHLFGDQWTYIHEENVGVGRISNFRNWVPELYGDSKATVVSMEYWCYDEDAIWSAPDEELIARASAEFARIGLLGSASITNGHVVRVRRCYPVYARGYRDALAPIVSYLKTFKNLWAIGRYGAFKYNNQDHSILMGLLVTDNICGSAAHDLWSVNTDYESYQESAAVDEGGLGKAG